MNNKKITNIDKISLLVTKDKNNENKILCLKTRRSCKHMKIATNAILKKITKKMQLRENQVINWIGVKSWHKKW